MENQDVKYNTQYDLNYIMKMEWKEIKQNINGGKVGGIFFFYVLFKENVLLL